MLNTDFQKLSVSGLITLYELDARNLGAGVMRWHGHRSFQDWQLISGAADEGGDYERDIIWQGEIYKPLAIQSDGLEVRGDGKASMPTLILANNINGQQGAVTSLCALFDDFAGARLTVIHTLAKYLDAANFANGNPHAANEYKRQVWFIEQKTSENAETVVFELSNPVDFEGQQIPTRDITNYCNWAVRGNYRGEECGYMGTAYYNEKGEPVSQLILDKCGGRLSDCRLRFGDDKPLPFGGFPSSSMI